MLVRSILFPVTTLGPGNRIGIWTQGCNHHCENCIEPKLWPIDSKYEKPNIEIISKCQEILNDNIVSGVTISGGEPMIQDDLPELLKQLKALGVSDVLVYSGYTLEEISMDSNMSKNLDYIDVLIDGKYIDSLNDNHPLRGSSNQKIIFLNESLYNIYQPIFSQNRSYEVIEAENTLNIIGIPPKDFLKKFEEKLLKRGISRNSNHNET